MATSLTQQMSESRNVTRVGGRFRVPITAVTALGAAVVIFLIARQIPNAVGIDFSPQGMSNLGQVLAPAVLISLFIERAVEVIITSWRDPEVQRLQHLLDTAADGQRSQAQRALDFFRLETQRLAFVLSFSLAFITALVGFRVVQPLLDTTQARALATSATDHAQWVWLSWLDVVITALLIAGGADGIHKIVTTFGAFLDSTRDRAAGALTPGGAQLAAPQPAAPVQQHAAGQPAAPQPHMGAASGHEFDDGV